jgi:hypothetical protein
MNTGDEGVSAQWLGGRLGWRPKPSSISRRPLGRFGFLGSAISDRSAAYDATVVTLSHARDRTKIELHPQPAACAVKGGACRPRSRMAPDTW